jgi:hypothetical protein
LLNIIAGTLSVGVTPSTSSYESIATYTVGGGGASDITFSSIPSGFKHLQIRLIGNVPAGATSLTVQFNSDTTNANYFFHEIYGSGSAVAATAKTGTQPLYLQYWGGLPSTSNIYGAGVIDILDYTNTNKYKTVRSLGGYDANGSGYIMFDSGLWLDTSAITSIKLAPSPNSFAQYSSFALYGIKGA